MNIHEYQAKELMSQYGVAVPKGIPAFSVDEAVKAAEELAKGKDSPVWVVKAQIHAGGRGKAGGVKVVKSIEEVKTESDRILGSTLVTHQTGPEGKEVQRLYIEEGCDIARELYLSLLIDRASSRVTIMASTEGGMEIEDVAEESPEKILKLTIDPTTGIMPFHCREVAFKLGLEGDQIKSCQKFLMAMYKCFIEVDADQVEINPLVITGSGDMIALDAKMGFDSNALFRQPKIEEMFDPSEADPLELQAKKDGLNNYVKLEGNIACLVNGAGLAMATMDIIKMQGDAPANFLDVGGSATEEQITAAFRLVQSDPNVKGILVNIFGGILRCDLLANGIVAASKEAGLNVPLVVRLEGTNVEEGKQILSDSGLPIITADNLADAAIKISDQVPDYQPGAAA